MEAIGKVTTNNRQIFYVSVQKDSVWFKKLPTANWVGFIVCDNGETEFEIDIAGKCMDKNIGYVCCAGAFCEKLHDIFNEEIVERALVIEKETGKEYDYENAPMTTWDNNFGNGVWFAMLTTYDGDKEFDKLICIDCTVKGVKKHIQNLIEKTNASWIPSDEKIEIPEYDS